MPESEYKDLITTFIECRHELLAPQQSETSQL